MSRKPSQDFATEWKLSDPNVLRLSSYDHSAGTWTIFKMTYPAGELTTERKRTRREQMIHTAFHYEGWDGVRRIAGEFRKLDLQEVV